MTTKKYPIGTRIKFIASERSCIAAQRDNGKTGVIVSSWKYLIGIHLPGSANNCEKRVGEITWLTKARNLQILPQKNQQLVFGFMK